MAKPEIVKSLTTAFVLSALLLSACTSPAPIPSSEGRETPTSEPTQSPTGAPADPLDQLWATYMSAYPDAVRPDVQLVRYVAPNEAAAAMDTCLEGEGFPDASATPDGSLQSGYVPPEQEESYRLASYVCAARFQVDPSFTQPLTDDRLKIVYAYYIDELIPCLEAEGYAISDPPSEATFVDTYLEVAWNPYLDVVDFSQSEWLRLNQACPQWPSGFFGF